MSPLSGKIPPILPANVSLILENEIFSIKHPYFAEYNISYKIKAIGSRVGVDTAYPRSNPTTLGEAFFRAQITESRLKDENNQAVDNNVRNQKDPNVNDKQELKRADDQKIKNVKYEEGKNVEDQQVPEGDDHTNNDDIDYMRQIVKPTNISKLRA
ncbi:hypothetical protein Tco_1012347 [Tanacetum coccineum]